MPRKNERFNEQTDVVYKDVYKLRENWSETKFTKFIDIGANLGITSVMASVLFPECDVHTFEPSPSTLPYLRDNLVGFKNITVHDLGIGNGKPFYMDAESTSTGAQMSKVKTSNMVKINTITFNQLLKLTGTNLDKDRVCVKVDCEGAERYLLDRTSTNLLKRIDHIGMEVHFKKQRKRDWDHMLNWEDYNNWVYKNFEKTHNILYHKSSKVKGIGIYVIRKK